MRLLVITSVFPSSRRPTKGTFNRALVAELRAAGDDVRVVSPIPWTDLFRMRVSARPEPATTYQLWWYPPRLAHPTHHRWMSHSVLPAALRATQSWQPDLVLGYWTHPDGTVALRIAKRLGVPGALLVGGSDIQLLTRNAARRKVIVATLRAADRVFAVGSPLRDAVIALGVPPTRVSTFVQGVDRKRFHPRSPERARAHLGLPRDRPIVLWVGRMVPVKGLDVLMRSWIEVARDPARPLLLLIGDGEERAALERAAAKLSDSIRLVGSIANDALPDWYRAADCVVLPSRSEGVPNVLVEGLACGTPYIASAVGGVTTLNDEESITVPPEDVAALTAALLTRVRLPPMSRRSVAEVPSRQETVASLREQLRSVIDSGDRTIEPVP